MKVLHDLEITRLCDLVESTSIYYDPASTHSYVTNISEHREVVSLYQELIELTGDTSDEVRSPWVLNIAVDRAKMYAARVTMQDIRYAIDNAMNNHESIVKVLVADDNADDLLIRIQIIEADQT